MYLSFMIEYFKLKSLHFYMSIGETQPPPKKLFFLDKKQLAIITRKLLYIIIYVLQAFLHLNYELILSINPLILKN